MDQYTSNALSLHSEASASPADQLAEQLARDMAESWKCGHPCGAEQMLANHPELYCHPRAAVRLVYEEMCQREGLGQKVSAEEIRARFPALQAEIDVLLQCHELILSETRAPLMPEAGDMLGEFRLLAVLGNGALGRVFLAEESSLAARHVVLKVTPGRGGEHLSLARLQHTHIVPLYAVREFPERGLRALCMPCLGGTTLDRILRCLERLTPDKRSGDDIRRALTEGVSDPRVHWQGRGSGWQYLERASYVQAICWIGLCAADALQYAHARGLLHLDLKPSNLLLTADGQPMLLDFHLAREPVAPGVTIVDGLGGTPAYMSPEQSLVWQAVLQGRAATVSVDGRSDVYSLAVVLAEALGAGPAGAKHDNSPFEGRNLRHLPTGLRDILARALKTDPADRYPDAAAFAEDLRRHLTDRALVGVRNRNPAERWLKWRRRRPHALAAGSLIVAIAVVAAFIARSAWNADRQRIAEATAALNDGTERLRRGEYVQAATALDHSATLLKYAYLGSELSLEVQRGQHLAARGQAVLALHTRAERLRFAGGNDNLPLETLRALEQLCRQTWDVRGSLLDAEAGSLRPQEEESVRTDLLDVALIRADLRRRLAGDSVDEEERRQALVALQEAESLFGSSCVLVREMRELGGADAGVDPEPRTAREHYAVGRWLLQRGNLDGAAAELERAVALQPQEFWSSFWRGLCACKRRQFDDAVTAFSMCIAQSPGRAECFCNRAIAYAALGQSVRARADYDKALELDSGLSAAALNRGALNLKDKRLPEAQSDLTRALALGADPAAVHFNLALLWQARHDRAAALASIDRALRHKPDYREARDLRARILDSKP